MLMDLNLFTLMTKKEKLKMTETPDKMILANAEGKRGEGSVSARKIAIRTKHQEEIQEVAAHQQVESLEKGKIAVRSAVN